MSRAYASYSFCVVPFVVDFVLWFWLFEIETFEPLIWLCEASTTPTQYVVNTLYWPHTALSVYLVCYFLVPHTHVLCMGSGSATGKKIQVRLVHSLLKYFFKFQLWYWIKNFHYQIFKFVIDNSDITSLNCLQHIQKRRNFDAKVTCHQPICLLLHAILSGVGVASTGIVIWAEVWREF